LKSIYGRLAIPGAVWREIEKYINVLELPSLHQFHVKVIPLSKPAPDYGLDDGETEAIELFEEINANRLLIDDKAARRVAESRNILCIGSLGVLVAAKNLNLISALRPLFAKLLAADRYYSINLLNHILLTVGESII
jgi:predicted nucleic acid-binding protein